MQLVVAHGRRQDDDRRHPKGHVARVLAEHSRRRGEGGAGAWGQHHLERPASRGRSRIADRRGRGLHHARCVGHRPGAARRSGPGGSGRRRGARENSRRHHRLGAERWRLRQLRRDRQPSRRADGSRGAREDAPARRTGRGASLRRRFGKHHRSRRRVPRRDRQAQEHPSAQLESVWRCRCRRRVQTRRGAAA